MMMKIPKKKKEIQAKKIEIKIKAKTVRTEVIWFSAFSLVPYT
jgi:hypothetical protein